MPESKYYKIKEKGDFTIILGSSRDCDYSLVEFKEDISNNHASLKRTGDRLFFKDLGSLKGTFVNGKRIGSKWREITLHDTVALGNIELEIGPTLLLGRDRVNLEARHLYFSVKNTRSGIGDRKILCSNVSFKAEPGTVTGIMGPAGAGKTVLLNILNGYISPEKGKVFVEGFDVHKSFGLIKDIIGYVPQDDTLIKELSVHESLHYCLRLRYPDMAYQVRQTLIQDVLTRMGFKDARLEKLLHSRIGSTEERVLSGGERKRVNIAHELVSNPLILFLDEPTSGLSSVDSKQVVSMLRQTATDRQVTILATIHQPARSIFNQFDNLMILNHGGSIAFFGPAIEAVSYFESYTQTRCENLNPAEYIMDRLYDWPQGQSPSEIFEAHQKTILKEESNLSEQEKPYSGKTKRKNQNVFRQFLLLTQRNLAVKMADRLSLVLIILQAIVIAMLLVFTFNGFTKDYSQSDRFAKTWFRFSSEKEKKNDNRESIIVQHLLKESKAWAEKELLLIGEQTAQIKTSVLFLLIASSIWFGIINGSREIISENTVLRRETKTYLCLSSYLISKLFILSLIAAFQTILLLGVACFFLLSFDLFFIYWIVLFITAVAASCLSLLISAWVKTEQAALMAVPIIIIPQLLLGGLIRPIKFLSDHIAAGFHFSDLILQKWAFKAMVGCETGTVNHILSQVVNLNDSDILNYLKFIKISALDMIFGTHMGILVGTVSPLYHPFLMIALHGLIPLIFTYVLLKKRYS